ncbi:hypothetical protein MHP7448_0708 [Mesomycoplasma hyopneumoniae 7448]|uniref:Uncharacterized protein n=1 Tax=Mesomycoplasma hyopneumoniae (strain 7448) TaxID=262722 RepID=A4Q7X5_MESH7|nr:hypothetical protein MHP7448_0708 [Mesomycoplasma hyopneumoniae 7448]
MIFKFGCFSIIFAFGISKNKGCDHPLFIRIIITDFNNCTFGIKILLLSIKFIGKITKKHISFNYLFLAIKTKNFAG